MWVSISRIILKNRIAILIILAITTVFMAFMSREVKMSYQFGGWLPETDSTHINYEFFKKNFSEDGNIMVLGVQGEELFELKHFQAWYDLTNDIKKINGIDSVFSLANLYNIKKNDSLKMFDFVPIVKQRPETQEEVDNIKDQVNQLPFYQNLLYQDSSATNLMMIFINQIELNSEKRSDIVENVKVKIDDFSEGQLKTYISGLPYVRTVITKRVSEELILFVALAAIVTALLLFLFFRSMRVVLFSLIVVLTGVIWSLGTIGIFGYELTTLMGLIPPLMIVIGIPNCIFLLNKYHHEFIKHGNKIKALTRVIQKIGNATFMTNTTTALGFATFIFTHSDILKEFGIIAATNIFTVFLLSILLIPITFSFLPEPKERHTKHLEKKWVGNTVELLVKMATGDRRIIYLITIIVLIIGGFGISKMQTTGNIVDDLPSDDLVKTDLAFFEDNFNGVMPFEVLIDLKKPGQLGKLKTLKKIEKLQKLLAEQPDFSKSLSIVDAQKFGKQALFNGNPKKYQLLNTFERNQFGAYFKNQSENADISGTFIDSSGTITRVTLQVADIGTQRMKTLLNTLELQIDSIFQPSEGYDVTLTGTSVVFTKGTTYLVKNLFISLCIAIVIIAIIMSILFRSWKMVLVSLIPNIIPLIITASIMGFFGIPIKPSTILVFSIAFGISVDDTIHYLAKYRQEFKQNSWNLRGSILEALRETGISMIYTSVVLFFGFAIFSASDFGGIVALGILVSVTLLVAMLANLVLLPSILLSLEKSIITKGFKEPLLEIINEEEDIELDALEIKKDQNTRS